MLAGFVGFVGDLEGAEHAAHAADVAAPTRSTGSSLLGGLLVIGLPGNGAFNKVILVIAIAFGTINVVGGFLVTDRMLEMFKSKPKPSRRRGTAEGS